MHTQGAHWLGGEVSLAAWEPAVIDALGMRFPNGRTAEKVVGEARWLFRFLGAHGIESWPEVDVETVHRWCWGARPDRSGRLARAAQSTARNRQWAALAAFDEAARLGAPIDPLGLIGERIARPVAAAPARPLTGREEHMVRDWADVGLPADGALLVALSCAGADASELACICSVDVDLDAQTVALRGDSARVNPLGSWPAQVVRLWLANRPEPPEPEELLCVGEGLTLERAAHSVTVRLSRALRDAGLGGRPGVTARSLRLTTAARILQQSGIAAAARLLGAASLDAAAAALGYDWRGYDWRGGDWRGYDWRGGGA